MRRLKILKDGENFREDGHEGRFDERERREGEQSACHDEEDGAKKHNCRKGQKIFFHINILRKKPVRLFTNGKIYDIINRQWQCAFKILRK